MKKIIFAFSAILAAQTASAGDYYICSNVNDTEEYVIEINLKTKKAAFFDNDAWSVLPLQSVSRLESYPPQTVYSFEGQDADGQPMGIRFNKTRLSGSVTKRLGAVNENRMEAQEGCKAVKASSLNSGI